MKILTILLALLFSVNAMAFPPVGAVGQGQTSTSYPTVNKAPNSQMTNIGGGAVLNETGNNNIVANPSFEHSTFNTNWTQTAGTSAVETTIVKHGAKAYKATLSAATLELYQDSTRYEAQFADGINGDREIWVKTSVSGIYVCPRNAGSTVLSACATVDSSGKWLKYNAPYVLGGTSNGIAVVSGTISSGVVTPGNVTGDVYVDGEAYVGEIRSIANASIITPWTAFTPTGSWTTNTTYSGKYRQVGDSLEIQYLVSTSGTPTSADLTLNMPTGFTIATGKLASSNSYVSNNVQIVDAATNFYLGQFSVNSATTFRVFRNTQTASQTVFNNLVTATAPFSFGSGDYIQGTITVPVAELSGSTQVFASQCGASCENVLSAKVSSAGVVSGENVDWINGNASIASTSQYSIAFTSGVFTVAPTCVVTPLNGAVYASSQEFTAVTASGGTWLTGRADTGVATAMDWRLVCYKTGADYQASRTIVGSFKPPESEIYVSGGNGHGSTNTKIRRFTTLVTNTASCITYADSATLGGTFTIGTGCAGLYGITYCDGASSAGNTFGVSKDSAQLTTNINSITESTRMVMSLNAVASVNYNTCASIPPRYYGDGSVIRAHTEGTMGSTTAPIVNFRITKVSL